MSVISSMITPDWKKFIPGLLLCALFAFVVMNIHHLLATYHKADAVSLKIPKIEKKIAGLKNSGAATDKIAPLEHKLSQYRSIPSQGVIFSWCPSRNC